MPKITRVVPGKTSKPKGVWERIRPIGFDPKDGIKLNLYGRSGTGKTTIWSTFPKPILAIICSGGTQPGELRSIDTPENRKGIDQFELTKIEEASELLDIASRDTKYQTVVLDHASSLQDYALMSVLGIEKLPAQRSWGMASQQDWGQCALMTKTVLRDLLSLHKNVVIVAQERDFNTEGDTEQLMPYVASALSPSVVGWLNPAVDYIGQTFIRQKTTVVTTKVGNKEVKTIKPLQGVEYCMRVAPDAVFTTKFRVPKGRPNPGIIVDPTYEKIMALIMS